MQMQSNRSAYLGNMCFLGEGGKWIVGTMFPKLKDAGFDVSHNVATYFVCSDPSGSVRLVQELEEGLCSEFLALPGTWKWRSEGENSMADRLLVLEDKVSRLKKKRK